MTTHLTKGAIQAALREVNIVGELFFTTAFNCEYINHKSQLQEVSTGIYYSTCNHPKGVEDVARCKPELCPFGKEEINGS